MNHDTMDQVAYRPWVDHYPPGVDWHADINLTPVFERALGSCEKYPDHCAYDFLGKTETYRDVGKTIEILSAALQNKLGVKKGTRVAMLLPNTPFYLYFYYAVLRAGGTIVNCNPLYTVSELEHIISDSETDIIVALDLKQIFSKAERLMETTKAKTLIACPFTHCLPMVKRILFNVAKRSDLANVGASRSASKIIGFDTLLKNPGTFTPVTIDPETDIAVQQYTGGTTGVPKGAMLSHKNISANLGQIDYWSCGVFQPKKRIVAVLPFFHIFSMTTVLNVSMANGMEMLMMPRFELKMLLEIVARKRPQILMAVPTLTHALCAAELSKKYDLTSLEVCVSGGAPLPDEVRQEFEDATGGRVLEGYGLTECSPVVCCSPFNAPTKSGSIGQPFPQTDVRFANIDEPAKLVEPGERGELQVKGPQVMLGYFKDAENTKKTFIDGWLRTGDVGYVDEDGHIYLVDRIKDLIISSGFNIYPRNIEEAIYRHPAVDECNVIGVPHEYKGEAPVAYIKLVEGKSATAEELRTFLKEHISKIELPIDFVFRKELPKTLVGKLSKKELRDDYAQHKKGN